MAMLKFGIVIAIGIYVFVPIVWVVRDFKPTKTITVYKYDGLDSNAYITGYKTIASSKIEVFKVQVKPVGIWDRLLLTNDDENMLADFFKIAAAITIGWYICQLNYENVFSKKSYKLFSIGVFLFAGIYFALNQGAQHTSDFYTNLFNTKMGKPESAVEFQEGVEYGPFFYTYWLCFIVAGFAAGVYDYLIARHGGKPEAELV